MNFVVFVAKRLFKNHENRKGASQLAVNIATGGVAIGIAVMIISVCVVLGFKQEIKDKLIGFGSHIQIQNYQSLISSESYPIAVNDSLLRIVRSTPNIAHWERTCYKAGILKTEEQFKGILLKGVAEEFDTTFIHKSLISGSLPRFNDQKASNEILISETAAKEMKLHTGDKISAYFFDNGIRARRFLVKGIYRTNLAELDNNIILTDLYTCNRLNGWQKNQCSSLNLTLSDYSKLKETTQKLAKRINVELGSDIYGASFTTMSIEDLYPELFTWLDLLNTNVWVILILMIGVAGITMISGLLIIILERTSFIGTLKALGARDRSIRHIFLCFSLFIVGRGLVIGNLLAFLLIFIQKQFGLVTLDPQVYYVEQVPLLINWSYIILLNLCALLISVCVLVIPSLLISRISPIKSIRFD